MRIIVWEEEGKQNFIIEDITTVELFVKGKLLPHIEHVNTVVIPDNTPIIEIIPLVKTKLLILPPPT